MEYQLKRTIKIIPTKGEGKMKYCKKCGQQIEDNVNVCPFCGTTQEEVVNVTVDSANTRVKVDSGSIGWGLLGFCIPIVGLVLFIVWKDDKPKSAKKAGIGALISVITTVVLGIALTVLEYVLLAQAY